MGILRKLQLSMMGFGLSMGLIFPVYASFFVEFKPGLEIYFNIGAVMAGITVGLVNHFLVAKFLIKPLSQIEKFAQSLGKGNLKSQVHIQSSDSVGTIANSLNHGVEELRFFLDNVFELINSNTRTSKIVQKHLCELSYNSQSLADALINMENGIERVQSHLAEVSLESHSLNEKLKTSHFQIEEVHNKIIQVDDLGTEVHSHSDQSIRQIHDLKSELLGIQKLADGMNEIIHTIDEIAEQTQLLSLNAHIEAASAGESGKGFAVVASEIKNLASSTNKSTAKIENQIEELQGSTKEVLKNLEGNAKHIIRTHEIFNELSSNLHLQAKTLESILGELRYGNTFARNLNTHINDIKKENEKITLDVHEVGEKLGGVLEHMEDIDQESDALLKNAERVSENLKNFQT